MNDTLHSYYEQELAYIRKLGAEFADKYPKIAGRLLLEPGTGKSEDLHVERLIEAFAFISGRIHKKIDDDFPEITQSLLNIIYPHYMAPIPSRAIVRFDPIKQNISKDGDKVPRDTPIFSSELVDGTSCNFKTCMPIQIWPVEVVNIAFKEQNFSRNDDSQCVLEIELVTFNNVSFSDLSWDHLRFFLNGSHQMFRLYELLLNNVIAIELETVDGQGKSVKVSLAPDMIRPAAFEDEEALLPFPSRSFPGYRLLLEYFCLPEKFLFLDFYGLKALRQLNANQSLTIKIYLNKFLTGISVNKTNFLLNVSPAINLFSCTAEPIRVEYMKPEYQVIPDNHRTNAMEIFSLDRVVSFRADSSEVVEFKPFYSIKHHVAEAESSKRQVFWHSKRLTSEKKEGSRSDVYISFVDLDFKPTDPDVAYLTASLTCTNWDLPSKLPIGNPKGYFGLGSDSQIAATVHCLSKPTKSIRPSLGRGLQWQLISHLSLNYLSIVQGGEDAFREILKLYDFEDSASTKQQISGIVSIKAKHVTRRLGLSVCRGVQITIELDEDKFVGAGMFLFASILERFFGQYVSVNSFSQLVVITKQGQEVLKEWPPRSGERVLM